MQKSHAHDHGPSETDPSQPEAGERRATNRRVVLKAIAGMAALSASGIGLVPGPAREAVAQEVGGTRAERFVPGDQGITAADAAAGDWVTWQANYPFWALGASWNGDVGLWPIIAVQFSVDGETWTETIDVAAQTEDGGQPNRDDRLFTPLIFTDGARSGCGTRPLMSTVSPARWTTSRSSTSIPPTALGRRISCPVEPLAPASDISTLTTETPAPPEIITRAEWGANENWRFDTYGEVWPPEYETVSHLIIHHTATANRPADVPNAIRAIYYYHAVEQGWGDIGYNYLVDHNGRIYQGRYGGQNVIGGHSYQFAIGSSGNHHHRQFHDRRAQRSGEVRACLDLRLGWSRPRSARDGGFPRGSGPADDLFASRCQRHHLPRGPALEQPARASASWLPRRSKGACSKPGSRPGIVPGDHVRVQTE